jgi:hypothetical protein
MLRKLLEHRTLSAGRVRVRDLVARKHERRLGEVMDEARPKRRFHFSSQSFCHLKQLLLAAIPAQ